MLRDGCEIRLWVRQKGQENSKFPTMPRTCARMTFLLQCLEVFPHFAFSTDVQEATATS